MVMMMHLRGSATQQHNARNEGGGRGGGRGRTSFTSCVLGSSGSRGVPVLWWYVRRVSPGGGFGTRGIESLRGSSSLTVMCRRLAPRSVWAAAGMSPVREPPTPAAARARPPPSDRDLPSRALKAACLFTKLSFVLTAITAELVAAEKPSGPRHGSGTQNPATQRPAGSLPPGCCCFFFLALRNTSSASSMLPPRLH